ATREPGKVSVSRIVMRKLRHVAVALVGPALAPGLLKRVANRSKVRRKPRPYDDRCYDAPGPLLLAPCSFASLPHDAIDDCLRRRLIIRIELLLDVVTRREFLDSLHRLGVIDRHVVRQHRRPEEENQLLMLSIFPPRA